MKRDGHRRRGHLAACVLLAITALAGCAGASGGQAAVVAAAGTSQPPATRRVDLAPVDPAGHPAPGWTVGTMYEDADNPIDCGPDGRMTPAPAAASGNIYACAPSAATADTCWPGARTPHMLCLMDPFSTVVEQLDAAAPVTPVAAPRSPVPLGLVLADGSRCRLRDGGAWGSPQAAPSYVGYYSCGQERGEVWATPDSPTGGIDTSQARWTVEAGGLTGPLTRLGVATAYYATTAG